MDSGKNVIANFEPPSTDGLRTIALGEGVVEGAIGEAGEFEPWLLEVSDETTVDIYLWSETGALDTHLWLYEGVATDAGANSVDSSDDNSSAFEGAVAQGILGRPVGGNYNSAVMGVVLESGTYSIVPRSYRDLGAGDYNLLVMDSSQ